MSYDKLLNSACRDPNYQKNAQAKLGDSVLPYIYFCLWSNIFVDVFPAKRNSNFVKLDDICQE